MHISDSSSIQYCASDLVYHQSHWCCYMGPHKWLSEHHWQMCLGRLLHLDWVSSAIKKTSLLFYSNFRGLSSILLCVIFLMVNISALTGILRSSSWYGKNQRTSHRLVYPWLAVYFIANCAIIPVGECTLLIPNQNYKKLRFITIFLRYQSNVHLVWSSTTVPVTTSRCCWKMVQRRYSLLLVPITGFNFVDIADDIIA